MAPGRGWTGGYKKPSSKSSSNARRFDSNSFPNSNQYQNKSNSSSNNSNNDNTFVSSDDTTSRLERNKLLKEREKRLDLKFGYRNLGTGEEKRGWIFQILATTVHDSTIGSERSGVDVFFLDESGGTFKSTIYHRPYFYMLSSRREEEDFEMLKTTLMRMLEGRVFSIEVVQREDLDGLNHLVGSGRRMLKLSFDAVSALMEVRDELHRMVGRNNSRKTGVMDLSSVIRAGTSASSEDILSSLTDVREYDVPYVARCCIDLDIRAGTWYTVTCTTPEEVELSDPSATQKAEPKVLAFDIECTKAPLKFPSADVDSIYMISYMISPGIGFLIINREVVTADVEDFEYTPKPTYPGPFTIWNERNEEDLIRRFLSHIEEVKPQIVVTYNGDMFDWPFLETRASKYNLDIGQELGIYETSDGEYRGRNIIHLDAFGWVKRDSYLPQGSQNLKAVTKYKLGYDPVSIDPEDMVRFAKTRPAYMATYSVSDAVATYYLYAKYVHLFIFSLCTIIPMPPEDVLRKGSGTLCEALLMVQASKKNIVCPNKHKDPLLKFHEGHLVESETFIGGKVECLETGVYRSDIEYDFHLTSSAFQGLINNIDRDLIFAIEVEGAMRREDVDNYDEVKESIIIKLKALMDEPVRKEKPFIYHLDVGAMYPNIILTNRLQPHAIVNDAICAACDFNQEQNACKRRMDWVWRGDYTPATKADYTRQKEQLLREVIDERPFSSLPEWEQAELVAKRVKQYAHKAYNKTKITKEQLNTDTVCMRENDFYVDTVRQFRDRRYEYKAKTKYYKNQKAEAKDPVSKKIAEDSELVYDSLQVAHKCILNSFYGYVMRKGARWRSMEMAGIVTKCGSDVITQARKLVEQIGRPLELDTDGIWCILPRSFPDVYTFKNKNGKKLKLEYPCVMLNADVHEHFSNHQYQNLANSTQTTFDKTSECSIFFEVDGPYRCMVLPSSTEENKLLKKRYAVFNEDGSLAELKGFELKRRGELEIVKTFQQQVFQHFLDGETLEECYGSVGNVANYWLDVLDTRGESLDTEELLDLITENRNMSRQLEDYGTQKGTSQTTARRLGEFLGADVVKDKGLNCKFIIAERPHGAPVTERAIPVAIWKSEDAVMKHYLKKWLKSPGLDTEEMDVRNIVDWDYYRARFAKTVQKIITIPAALQNILNPVPRIPHPDWLQKTVRRLNDKFQQKSITDCFTLAKPKEKGPSIAMEEKKMVDIEDMMSSTVKEKRPMVHTLSRTKKRAAVPAREGAVVLSTPLPPKVTLNCNNFQDWLARKKRVWQSARSSTVSKKHKTTFPFDDTNSTKSSAKRQAKSSTMEGYIRDAANTLSSNELQVLEIRESNEKSGDVIVWVMIQDNLLQRVHISVPRVIYINCYVDISPVLLSKCNLTIRKVDRFLPHSKPIHSLYEVQMEEYQYRKEDWREEFLALFTNEDAGGSREDLVEGVYESKTPLLFRALVDLGCVSKVTAPSLDKSKKRYPLSELARVERPSQGEYLHKQLSYRRIFYYEFIHPKLKIGILALFIMSGGSGGEDDVTRPETIQDRSFSLNATCQAWIVKPGGAKGQKNISTKRCGEMFTQMLNELCTSDSSEFTCLSNTASSCSFQSLTFVDQDRDAYIQVQNTLGTYLQEKHGPTFLIVNSSRPIPLLRKTIPMCNEFPFMSFPFPPGSKHNQPSLLPSLNWEPSATLLCLEAFIYMSVINFPQRAAASRFGHVPIGNLDVDEYCHLYDVGFARMLKHGRSLIWANETPNPDLGRKSLGGGDSSSCFGNDSTALWGDKDDYISPTIVRPGAYRNICVEIDVQNLAIAAMTDVNYMSYTPSVATSTKDSKQHDNPNDIGAALGNGGDNNLSAAISTQTSTPLGDEMSCATALQILRSLVHTWKSEALEHNCVVSDNLLCHFYRLICSQSTLLHDSALHRVVHSLMKSCFIQLIVELQRLGATIISASFHRIIIATNKVDVSAAKEYIQFVINTVMNCHAKSEGIGCITLVPTNVWSNFLYLDEYNFGGMLLEPKDADDDYEDELEILLDSGERIVPTVYSGWNIMQFLPSEIQQEYFRAIIGRFSKDVYKKQRQLQIKDKADAPEVLLEYKKKVISKHFTSYLTRAVGEITSSEGNALEFINNVLVILELDNDVQYETHFLKNSLLAQVGVQEYSTSSVWKNPCASFVVPDLYCSECHECRDVNLCVLRPPLEDEQKVQWECLDCNSPYNTELIECRVIDMIQRESAQYQMQDLRCTKSGSVQTHAMSSKSLRSADWKLDRSRQKFLSQLRIVNGIAEEQDLDWLMEIAKDCLDSFEY